MTQNRVSVHCQVRIMSEIFENAFVLGIFAEEDSKREGEGSQFAEEEAIVPKESSILPSKEKRPLTVQV
jgi:hypothetical protein